MRQAKGVWRLCVRAGSMRVPRACFAKDLWHKESAKQTQLCRVACMFMGVAAVAVPRPAPMAGRAMAAAGRASGPPEAGMAGPGGGGRARQGKMHCGPRVPKKDE